MELMLLYQGMRERDRVCVCNGRVFPLHTVYMLLLARGSVAIVAGGTRWMRREGVMERGTGSEGISLSSTLAVWLWLMTITHTHTY